MSLRKLLLFALTLILGASSLVPAVAGKKGPKPYKSEEGIILVPHTMLYSSSGEVNSVTANEFESRCAIPASNGFDAYVYEVPKEYQTIQAEITAHGKAQAAWDMYAFFYDKDCKISPTAVAAQGAVTMADAEGVMPAGTAYVLLADFAGDPATVSYELKPYKG